MDSYPDPGERLAWLDLLKVISAFAVVMTHIASIGWQAVAPTDVGWFTTSVYEIATRFAVPAFFMTSGALLLNPRRTLSTRSVLGKAVKMSCIALAVSLLYCLVERALMGWTGWRSLIMSTVDGPYFIWYLWVLVGLYALTPILRLVSEKSESLRYSLALLAFFVLGKSTVSAMLPGTLLATWFDNFILFSSGMEGLFYYLLGAWLISHRPSQRLRAAALVIGLISLVLAVALNYRSALLVGPDLYYVARDNLLIAAFSLGVFELLRWRGGRLQPNTFVSLLTKWGMGIYLTHPFFRLAMEELPTFSFCVQWLLADPLVSIPVISFLIWGLSVATSALINAVVSKAKLRVDLSTRAGKAS